MSHGMTRRQFAIAAGATTLAFGSKAQAEATSVRTLRFIAAADLRVLDPIWTTAYIARNHGYMGFDKFQPHPQMVGDYSVSPDQLLLQFHIA
jgi:peptide/nickel transport system substrate-binding protein